jgi:hypothetical protein
MAFVADVGDTSAVMRLMRALAIAAFVALGLAPSVARADASDDSHARYEQGVAAFQKGDFGAAVSAFADVYRVTGETKHLWNLAFAEYQAKRTFDALGHMRAYIAKADANPKNLERAHGYEAALAKKVTRVKLVAPDGAEVDVDGAQYGTAPLDAPIELDPEKPHVIVAKRGADSAKQTLGVLGAKSIDVTLAFPVASPMPVVAPPPAAAAPASAPPPAQTPTVQTPPVSAATVAPPPPAPAPEPSTPVHHGWGARTWLTIGLGVGAAAAIGTGIYFGLQSSDDASTAAGLSSALPSSSTCGKPTAQYAQQCSHLSSALSSQGSENTASIVFYSVGGALAVGAVAAFLFVPRDSSPSTSGYVVPMVGRDLAGAGYAGHF